MSSSARSLALHDKGRKSADDRPPCLENPRPEWAEPTLTENAASRFHAEPGQLGLSPGPASTPTRANSRGLSALSVKVSADESDEADERSQACAFILRMPRAVRGHTDDFSQHRRTSLNSRSCHAEQTSSYQPSFLRLRSGRKRKQKLWRQRERKPRVQIAG